MNASLFPWDRVRETVARFGTATLLRHRDGRYELSGGSASERAAAHEWASLFQHDAVFPLTPEARPSLPAQPQRNHFRAA
jgi:hypothetical protein